MASVTTPAPLTLPADYTGALMEQASLTMLQILVGIAFVLMCLVQVAALAVHFTVPVSNVPARARGRRRPTAATRQ